MNMHLEEIVFHVAPGAHAVVILDQAGWHGSTDLVVPPNITLLPLPPRCPELNPVENIWTPATSMRFRCDRGDWAKGMRIGGLIG
jgi:hypothetical protein